MTIEELQAQRQEINRQIRELRKQGEVEAPGARIVRKTSYTGGPPEWSVRIGVDQNTYRSVGKVTRYLTVYTGGTKRECIDAIPGIVGVLRGLYEAATKGESE
jgi:hypothetical protein